MSYALFDNETVAGNVAFGPRMHGVPADERADRVERLLSLLDISDLADRNPRTGSDGQQQRVGIARALAVEHRRTVAGRTADQARRAVEEPSAGRDPHLLDSLGVTALYVTPDQVEAMTMCDRVAVLNDGRVEQVAAPATLYHDPATEFVAPDRADLPFLDG